MSLATSSTTDFSRSKIPTPDAPVCVTDRCRPVAVLVTVTVSVAVAPVTVSVPLTTRLWPIRCPDGMRCEGSA